MAASPTRRKTKSPDAKAPPWAEGLPLPYTGGKCRTPKEHADWRREALEMVLNGDLRRRPELRQIADTLTGHLDPCLGFEEGDWRRLRRELRAVVSYYNTGTGGNAGETRLLRDELFPRRSRFYEKREEVVRGARWEPATLEKGGERLVLSPGCRKKDLTILKALGWQHTEAREIEPAQVGLVPCYRSVDTRYMVVDLLETAEALRAAGMWPARQCNYANCERGGDDRRKVFVPLPPRKCYCCRACEQRASATGNKVTE
ncbi:MAG: hypothetical protein FJX75_27510 [Armatimonadetes bacterium]|nr:hypothetical protein [Armatimonadota bacterium]